MHTYLAWLIVAWDLVGFLSNNTNMRLCYLFIEGEKTVFRPIFRNHFYEGIIITRNHHISSSHIHAFSNNLNWRITIAIGILFKGMFKCFGMFLRKKQTRSTKRDKSKKTITATLPAFSKKHVKKFKKQGSIHHSFLSMLSGVESLLKTSQRHRYHASHFWTWWCRNNHVAI